MSSLEMKKIFWLDEKIFFVFFSLIHDSEWDGVVIAEAEQKRVLREDDTRITRLTGHFKNGRPLNKDGGGKVYLYEVYPTPPPPPPSPSEQRPPFGG